MSNLARDLNEVLSKPPNTSNLPSMIVCISSGDQPITLTRRETECFYFLSQAYTTKKIARALNLSPRTIETYINNIKDKLGVMYKSEIVEKAIHYYFHGSSNLLN